ncbi:helix-turn-helix domain-containing protein [Salinispora cortesiana]|uniref:helix-turn-helix domain-containing protein n=1 Tax=Salinispora cortesiana TaxID=1305843 RepID=UPI00165F2F14|nr:XRE family transcriptional regulator [Salinispora cortesiana]
MDLARTVGSNVHRLRSTAGMSLADLATAGDISKTTLHSIEQGHGNPTLSTLWALATALRVPLGALLETPTPNTDVVRADDQQPRISGDAVSARLLHRIQLRGTVEVYDIEVAQTAQHSPAHLPGVQECLILTHGSITTGPADATATLAEHDSIRFDANRPHQYQGNGQRNRAILLMLHPET